MAVFARPVAKSVYICDDVVHDPHSGKVSLLNLWDAIHVPAGMEFPYCLAKVCVFTWWCSGLGKIRTRIDLVQASTGNVIRRTKDCIIDFPIRTASVFARYRFENCTFPDPGFYYIELFCQDEFVDDQVIEVF